MKYLLDTNVLLRLIEVEHPHHTEAEQALETLHLRHGTFYVLLQNISEFWNVCTRPSDKNGLGLSVAQADVHLNKLEKLFIVLIDTEEVYKEWRKLIVDYAVSGTQVHDARIVAAMKIHDIRNLLTFNAKDFKRYEQINALDPKESLVSD